jgi:hypothetical protein
MKPLTKLFLASAVATLFLMTGCSGVPQSASGSGATGGTNTIGGTVTGMTGTGLVLQDNGGDNLTVTANGTFTFATKVATGAAYAVTVATQPTNPAQSCTVAGGTGTASASVTTVAVTCTAAAVNATIGGKVSGLTGTGLVLQDNGGDSLTITANGSFTFKTPVTGTYAVTVLTQPLGPAQLCTVAKGSGTASANVTTVTVTCVLSYTIGGTVTGVVGSGLVLADNGGDKLTVTANGPFVFPTPLATGSAYAVTIATQPSGPAQTCTVTSGTGTGTATANVTGVAITCAAVTYSVGGNVVGLLGHQPPPPNNSPLTDSSFTLQNNTGDNKTITQNGPFTFATPVALNGAYNVTVFTPPSTQTQPCWTFGYSGVVTGNVTSVTVDCGHNDWTWINGSNTAGTIQAPQYGLFTALVNPPINPYTNTPGARDSGAAWTDASGNLWLFGGLGWELTGKTPPDTLYGDLRDLWECRMMVDQCQWVLVSDLPSAMDENLPGVYGTKGTASGSNTPGSRWGSATSTNPSNILLLFGGEGQDSVGAGGLLNDLWKLDTVGQTWTWVSGSNLVDQPGIYSGGSAGPGARWAPVSWTDASGNLWIFGGQGYDGAGNLGLLSDLWKFNGTTWTFVSGSNTVNQNGVYGTQGVAASSNVPGGRQAAVGWVDSSGNLWLFGGEGEDATGTANGILNDLWEYNIAANQWTFVAGSSAANQTGVYGSQPSIGPVSTTNAAGTVGLANTSGTLPGSRWGATAWTDDAGNLWLFGGWGQDATGTNGNGFLNDLWVYTPNAVAGQPGTWVWVKGSNTGNQNGVYGSLTRPYAPYVGWTPGGRRGASHWVDATGELWLLGGQGYDSTGSSGNGYLNDMWRYRPYP